MTQKVNTPSSDQVTPLVFLGGNCNLAVRAGVPIHGSVESAVAASIEALR